MPSLILKKSDIPLWTGSNGTLDLNLNGDLHAPVTPGANPIVNATFQVDGNQSIALAAEGTVGIGINAGAHARIVPIFRENVGAGADLVGRFSLADSLTASNVLLALEIGGNASLSAQGSFKYSVLTANATLEAGADATYLAIRSFPRADNLQPMLESLFANLALPGAITRPPQPNDLISFEYGGFLNFNVGASAGYELKGTKSFKVSEIALSEHYALSIVGKLSLTGQVAGRFSVDVTAGSEPGFARVRVSRRREKELQFAADVNVRADVNTEGLPPTTGKEFLGALLGLEAKNWLNLVDGLVTEAGEVDSIEKLKAKLDGLALDYLSEYAGKAIDQITEIPEVEEFQKQLGEVVDSYRNLDQRAIALFDRYADPILDRIPDLSSVLAELDAITSWDQLKGEVNPLLWNVLRQLTGGDPLGWALGMVPGTSDASLPKLKGLIAHTRSLIEDAAHAEIRKFIQTAKEHFKLDGFFDQLASVTTKDGLKALANQKLGHFVQRLIGDAVGSLNGNALTKAFDVVQKVVKARNKFFDTFDKILKDAAAQTFTADLHAAYSSASERQALIDMELRLVNADGSANTAGIRLMQAAGRGDFQEALDNFQPSIVRLREGVLTHKVTKRTTLSFNITGWHRAFHYEAMHQVIVNTEQQIRNSGTGLLTVFTNIDMSAKSERRKRGSKSEEAILSNFLLRLTAESKVSDSNFDEKTQQYVLDVITGMSARYDVTFTDTDTSSAELDEYLLFAKQLGLDRVGANREALAPVLELQNGSFGKTESTYEVAYTEESIRHLVAMRPDAADIRQILRRIVLANYFNHPVLHDVGWLYGSDDVRKLFDEQQNNFIDADSILGNASVRLTSPIPGIRPPARFSNQRIIRNDVAILFRIEDKMIAAFDALANLLQSPTAIKTADLEKKLEAFGDVLQSFDSFDEGENSIFAIFDGLILLATEAGSARSSSLTFKSSKDGKEHTKVFTLRAALAPLALTSAGSQN